MLLASNVIKDVSWVLSALTVIECSIVRLVPNTSGSIEKGVYTLSSESETVYSCSFTVVVGGDTLTESHDCLTVVVKVIVSSNVCV